MTATQLPLPAHAAQAPIGRYPVLDVQPVVDGGARPAVSVVDEDVLLSATVFREGHDAVSANGVLVAPDGSETVVPLVCDNPGLSHWVGTMAAPSEGMWGYRVEAWGDPYATWVHDATIKVQAGIDSELMFAEGVRVLTRALEPQGGAGQTSPTPRTPEQAAVIQRAIDGLSDSSLFDAARLAAGTSHELAAELAARPLRDHVSSSPTYRLRVERERALYGAWYEFFPRSEGCHIDPATGLWVTGTFRSAAERLPAVAAMGFDVIYLTPVHPIGTTNRKGPNNTLTATELDPGSPYAIGSAEGGHDALHPDLGTWEDFDAFVERARSLDLEVALDLALQCSPDHPWVTEHPEWFTERADGSIAYAENPPKKYQDIYPLNFDNDPEGIYREVRRVIQVWLDHGVRIFRVDNPHTKPVEFWQWLIADVATEYPETIWLAEAFTKPAMMRTLAKVGFQQSYTYFAWRHTKPELEEYMRELATETAPYMRPSFWPTTHDILTPFMQNGGVTAHKLRSALAAMLVPTYGIYAGYEHCESTPRPGAEEHIDNEKYEFKDRQWYLDEGHTASSDLHHVWTAAGRPNLAPWLRRLNEIRRAHPALHHLRNISFHRVDHPDVMAFSKRRRLADGTEDVIIVVANLDPHSTVDTTVHLTMPALGLGWADRFTAHDLVSGQVWSWGEHPWVRLGPETEPVHIVHLRKDS